jgi:hypothetical protein
VLGTEATSCQQFLHLQVAALSLPLFFFYLRVQLLPSIAEFPINILFGYCILLEENLHLLFQQLRLVLHLIALCAGVVREFGCRFMLQLTQLLNNTLEGFLLLFEIDCSWLEQGL